jgi:hypothetical protein
MTMSRLARGLGLDGNPLRRRTDKLAVCLAALLVAVFLAGVPVVSMAAIGAASRLAAAGQQGTRSWRQVSAVVQKTTPAPPAWELSGYTWVQARWTAPDGQARAGQIPVSAAVVAGQTIRVWVDQAGMLTGPPPNGGVVIADEVTAAGVAVAVLGIVLLCVACAGRWVLDRRRLASWEAAWADVGPRWTRRFQSRG